MRKFYFSSIQVFVLLVSVSATGLAATEKVLYGFTGGIDGSLPSSSLTMDGNGNLYGTASAGGTVNSNCSSQFAPGCGVVFELKPKNGAWQESVLYAFQGGADGEFPSGNLLLDASGNLYGTTVAGGTGSCGTFGCGTVFELSPNPNGWTKTTIYDFQSAADGDGPDGLTFDTAGNLYGITPFGGPSGTGVAYELLPSKSGGTWTKKAIFGFTNFEIQLNPVLTFDRQGNLYGTFTQLYSCYIGCGTVFQLTFNGNQWAESDLLNFPGGWQRWGTLVYRHFR